MNNYSFTTILYTVKWFKLKSLWSLFHLRLLKKCHLKGPGKISWLPKVAFEWSKMSLYIQRSSFRLSANYVLNNVLRALRVKLLFENSLCYSIKWILHLGNESDFYLSGNNVAEVNILELMYEISTYCLWPLKPFSVPFGVPAQSDYFQSLSFCPNISLAGFGVSLQVSLWAFKKGHGTCFFHRCTD